MQSGASQQPGTNGSGCGLGPCRGLGPSTLMVKLLTSPLCFIMSRFLSPSAESCCHGYRCPFFVIPWKKEPLKGWRVAGTDERLAGALAGLLRDPIRRGSLSTLQVGKSQSRKVHNMKCVEIAACLMDACMGRPSCFTEATCSGPVVSNWMMLCCSSHPLDRPGASWFPFGPSGGGWR